MSRHLLLRDFSRANFVDQQTNEIVAGFSDPETPKDV
jgi:hypothetical protein